MKRHLIVPLVLAGVLLGALPALARDSHTAVTITAHLGGVSPWIGYPPPAYVVVREPVYRERPRVIYVERDRRRQHECDERVKVVERVYYDDHRHRRHNDRGMRRGWERWEN